MARELTSLAWQGSAICAAPSHGSLTPPGYGIQLADSLRFLRSGTHGRSLSQGSNGRFRPPFDRVARLACGRLPIGSDGRPRLPFYRVAKVACGWLLNRSNGGRGD